MKNEAIDHEVIAALIREITHRIELMTKFIPKEKEPLVKQLAAASIHLAFFAKDLYADLRGEKIDIDKELEEKFLNECGCNLFNTTNKEGK
jgi:hypothetical protein